VCVLLTQTIFIRDLLLDNHFRGCLMISNTEATCEIEILLVFLSPSMSEINQIEFQGNN